MEMVIAHVVNQQTPLVLMGGVVDVRQFVSWVNSLDYVSGWTTLDVQLYTSNPVFAPRPGYTFGQGMLTFITPFTLKKPVCPPISCVSWMPIAHVSVVPSNALQGVVLPSHFSLSDTSDDRSCGPSTRQRVPILGYAPIGRPCDEDPHGQGGYG
jgi:hypothetical protein